MPAYPPLMGLDPPGLVDEYAGFADTAWAQVEARHFSSHGFDISPAIGFAMQSPPHMWNYHAPGFMTASLLHDEEHEVTDGFLWQMRDIEPLTPAEDPGLPWWHGDRHFAHYSNEQAECVVRYLRYIRDHGSGHPHHFQWEAEDGRTLARWLSRARSR